MADTYTDNELRLLLPDYMNHSLSPELRAEVDRFLSRSPEAKTDLENLELMVQEIAVTEKDAPIDEAALERFITYAQINPLVRKAKVENKIPWWKSFGNSAWLKPAFAFAICVIVGQSAVIGLMANNGGVADDSIRSLTKDAATGRVRGPVLNVQIDPEAPLADVMSVIKSIDGTIIFGSPESTILYVEVPKNTQQAAQQKLKQSKIVLNVIEIPSADSKNPYQ